QIRTWGGVVGDLRRAAAFPGHGVSGGQLGVGGSHRRAFAPGPAYLSAGAAQRDLPLSATAELSGSPLRMKSREELLREAAEHPERLVEYISALQEQLGQTGQELTVVRQDLQHQQQHLA